jgi:hypothetical protein
VRGRVSGVYIAHAQATLYPYGGLPRGGCCARNFLFVNCVSGKVPVGLLFQGVGEVHPIEG